MGIGSKLKKAVRKIIPNELSEIAVAAAPFVAPFNPAIAAAMAGIGGFDQTGRIGKSLKSAALTYGLGNLARGIGGAGPQWGWKSAGTGTGLGSYFTSPISGAQLWGTSAAANPIQATGQMPEGFVDAGAAEAAATEAATGASELTQGLMPEGFVDAGAAEAASTAASTAANASTQVVQGSLQNATGATFKEFMKASVSDKLKLASEWWAGLESKTKWALGLGSAAAALQYLENKALEDDKIDLEKGDLAYKPEYRNIEDINPTVQLSKNGGIIGLANGGEPTMEMDYRGGGFIPVGAKERADDVPARLSKNEFVMTADAVRAAGGGSVDVGAQRMYNLMNQLEAVA